MTTPADDHREREIAALETIAGTLSAIGDVLAAIHAALLATTPATVECPHPPRSREDLGSTMGHEWWRCSACGYTCDQSTKGGLFG